MNILNRRNNLIDVMAFVEGLSPICNVPPEQMKLIAQEVLYSIRCRPAQEELVLIYRKLKIPIRDVMQNMNIHSRTLYRIYGEDKKNPRIFYPRLATEQIELIKSFVNLFNSLKEVLL